MIKYFGWAVVPNGACAIELNIWVIFGGIRSLAQQLVLERLLYRVCNILNSMPGGKIKFVLCVFDVCAWVLMAVCLLTKMYAYIEKNVYPANQINKYFCKFIYVCIGSVYILGLRNIEYCPHSRKGASNFIMKCEQYRKEFLLGSLVLLSFFIWFSICSIWWCIALRGLRDDVYCRVLGWWIDCVTHG